MMLTDEAVWKKAIEFIRQNPIDKWDNATCARLAYAEAYTEAQREMSERVKELEELLRMVHCPELLIEHPRILDGKVDKEGMEWARKVIESRKEQHE